MSEDVSPDEVMDRLMGRGQTRFSFVPTDMQNNSDVIITGFHNARILSGDNNGERRTCKVTTENGKWGDIIVQLNTPFEFWMEGDAVELTNFSGTNSVGTLRPAPIRRRQNEGKSSSKRKGRVRNSS